MNLQRPTSQYDSGNACSIAMRSLLLYYCSHHPFRSPAWRWNYADDLLQRGTLPVPRFKDPWIRTAYELLLGQATPENAQWRLEHTQTLSDAQEAHDIYQINSPARWELEARILAGEPYAAIAEKLNMRIGVVKAFQNLFFHVKPKLACRDYITRVVIGLGRPWKPHRVRDLWCYFGYFGGADVLDVLMQDFRACGRPDYGHVVEHTAASPHRSPWGKTIDRCLRAMFLQPTNENMPYLIDMRIELLQEPKPWKNPLDERVLQPLIEKALSKAFRKLRNARANPPSGPAEIEVA